MPDPQELLYPTRKERTEDRRKERHQRKLLDEFFDHATLMAVSRMITQGQFLQIDYPISTGKEGGVFRASGPDFYRAVKIYRVGNTIFRRLPPEVLGELLKETSAGNFARLVHAWTRREHTILRQMRAAGVRCPEPFGYWRNVLVMEFIGTDGLPAPTLQESVVADPPGLYRALTAQVRRMVVDARLVHGDLSPYNILLSEEEPVLIDVAQAIPAAHPEARRLLERDIVNFVKFFARIGVPTTASEMLRDVGGEQLGAASEAR